MVVYNDIYFPLKASLVISDDFTGEEADEFVQQIIEETFEPEHSKVDKKSKKKGNAREYTFSWSSPLMYLE
jgi:hypothetical protein